MPSTLNKEKLSKKQRNIFFSRFRQAFDINYLYYFFDVIYICIGSKCKYVLKRDLEEKI